MSDDYSRIQQAAVEEKKSRFIADWVDKKISKNYVEVKINSLGDYSRFLIDEKGNTQCAALARWMKKP
jgi:peptidyl-prolyl cis-trans isomerase SurA